jgi:hypothetical protein
MQKSILIGSVLLLGVVAGLYGYNQIKKPVVQSTNAEIAQEVFPIAPVINRKTNYSNGVITNVRVLEYYTDLVKTGIPMKDAKFGLTTIITEWNKYDANVASPQGGIYRKRNVFDRRREKANDRRRYRPKGRRK